MSASEKVTFFKSLREFPFRFVHEFLKTVTASLSFVVALQINVELTHLVDNTKLTRGWMIFILTLLVIVFSLITEYVASIKDQYEKSTERIAKLLASRLKVRKKEKQKQSEIKPVGKDEIPEETNIETSQTFVY